MRDGQAELMFAMKFTLSISYYSKTVNLYSCCTQGIEEVSSFSPYNFSTRFLLERLLGQQPQEFLKNLAIFSGICQLNRVSRQALTKQVDYVSHLASFGRQSSHFGFGFHRSACISNVMNNKIKKQTLLLM